MTEKNLIDECMMWYQAGVSMNTGIPLLRAFKIVSDDFPAYKDNWEAATNAVRTGEYMGNSFGDDSFFSQTCETLISGEQTGILPKKMIELSGMIASTLGSKDNEVHLSPYNPDTVRNIIVFKSLAELVESGMPLIAITNNLSNNFDGENKKVFQQLSKSMEAGSTFYEAMSHNPDYFSEFSREMTRCVEVVGLYEIGFNRLADFYKRDLRIRAGLFN